MLWRAGSRGRCFRLRLVNRSGNLQFSKPNAKPVPCIVTRSACEPKELLLRCFRRSLQFRKFLSAVAMFVPFVTPISNRHSPVFPFLIDGYLVISMSLAFRAVDSHFLRDFHTDHRNFNTSGYVVYLLLMALTLLF